MDKMEKWKKWRKKKMKNISEKENDSELNNIFNVPMICTWLMNEWLVYVTCKA